LPVTAAKGQWMCEAFLWTHWSHCGTARASQTSRLLALDAEKFQSIIATFPTPHARHYAELFVEAINEFEIDELTDLETLMDELDDLIEEAFPVEEDEAENGDSDDGLQEGTDFLGGSSDNLGVSSQTSSNIGQDRRVSFSRQSSARRSGDLKTDKTLGKSQKPNGQGKRLSARCRRHGTRGPRSWPRGSRGFRARAA